MKSDKLIQALKTKAKQSSCNFKMSAIALDAKGDVLGSATNVPRFAKVHGSLHAEHKLIIKYGKRIRHIIICRISKSGELLPIGPCYSCLKLANKFGIQIHSVME